MMSETGKRPIRRIAKRALGALPLGGALLVLSAAAAGAGGPPPPPRVEWAPSPLEFRGCYYYRGREHCGRYCYLEINGKRYCQERYREAHPQAGPEHFFIPEPRPYAYGAPGYGMK